MKIHKLAVQVLCKDGRWYISGLLFDIEQEVRRVFSDSHMKECGIEKVTTIPVDLDVSERGGAV